MNHAVIGARGEVGAAYCSILRRKAKIALIVTSAMAPLPLITAHWIELPLFSMILEHPLSLAFFILAIGLVPCVWFGLNSSIWTTRARMPAAHL